MLFVGGIFFFNKTKNNNEMKIKPINLRFVRKEKSFLGATAERVELDRIKHLSWSVDRAADSLLKID